MRLPRDDNYTMASIFDEIFGAGFGDKPARYSEAEFNTESNARYALGLTNGFDKAVKHIEKFLLRNGELKLAEQVAVMKLGPK